MLSQAETGGCHNTLCQLQSLYRMKRPQSLGRAKLTGNGATCSVKTTILDNTDSLEILKRHLPRGLEKFFHVTEMALIFPDGGI